MLANSINILKENYKFILSTMFYALLAAGYFIASADTLIYYRTGTHLTLVECLVISLQLSVFALIYSFNKLLKPSFILHFLSFFCFWMAYDSFRKIFSNNEYHLLSGVVGSAIAAFVYAIWVSYSISKSGNK